MDNNSVNASVDITTSTVDIGILIVSGAFFLICVWIIILNGLLIICFWVNKRETWFSHSKNILSIIIIDLLVGLTTLMTFLASMKVDMDLYECLVAMALCLASQTATSLNVLRFCVTRFISIRKTSLAQEPSAPVVIAQTLFIWISSSAIVLIPLILWSEKTSVLKRCQWNYLFHTNEATVDLYMFHVLTIPTVLTTVLYGILSVKLQKARNFVHPTGRENVASYKKSQHSGSDTKSTLDMSKYTRQDAPSTSGKLSDDNIFQVSQKDCSDIATHGAFKRSSQASELNLPTASNHQGNPVSVIKPTATSNRKTRMNKVIATIGVLLVLINISNLPFIVILALIAINPDTKVPGIIGMISILSLMLNSACNPIIYAVRLKPLRHAFLKMYKHCFHALFKIICCKV